MTTPTSTWWRDGGDTVAWTEHDGPSGPPAGPSPNLTTGLAVAWAGWLALAFVGCMVFHDDGASHLHTAWWLDVLGAGFLVMMPIVVFAVAKGRELGLWLAVGIGGVAIAGSLSQWSVVPWYTAIESAGFVILTLATAALAVWSARARHQARTQRRLATGVPPEQVVVPVPAAPAPAADRGAGEPEPARR